MPIFYFTVVETVAIEKIYVVEAPDLTAAEEKAGIGDTIEEETIRTAGVIDREVTEHHPDPEW